MRYVHGAGEETEGVECNDYTVGGTVAEDCQRFLVEKACGDFGQTPNLATNCRGKSADIVSADCV